MSSLSRKLVFLILQFLDEEKFKETVHKLEQESGFFFNMKYFEDQIQAGEWDEVERYLSGFTKLEDNRYSTKIFFEIRKQKYLEALDRQDRVKDVEILVKDLKVFSSFSEDLSKEITQLPTLDNFSVSRQNEQLSKYGDTKSTRNVMLVELKKLIEANPLFLDKLTLPSFEASHLRTLINQREEIIEEKEMHKVKDQCSRSSRPTTIHGFAQYGDLVALQKLLQDNPSLLNDSNPVMAQTPLHVSAGYNNIEIMQFLLDWPGAEKVELEAKNMYGETPLHMAAKNGCNEAVKMLLARGAFVEAEANNGMTPLHLAVRHSLQSEDYSTVKTLLESDADGSAEDSMEQTPLHVSAGYNNVEIMKYLLDWPGAEKVELEAKNTDGETPLHMAAKNGCNEAVKVLLARGAFVEAKANNGMTPLHLAVQHSLRSEDYSTVKTLLESDADGNAEDDEGMTPLNHLSQGQGSEKLQELLHNHLEEQRKRGAIKACCETKAKMEALESELANIMGLHSLKLQLRKWAKGMLLDEERRALGLEVGPRRPPHMAFLGNPGTGKTMVARILGKLLHILGILPTDKVTEVQRTDLVGKYLGHTGPKTRRKIREGEGGILFVDEAYRLIPKQKSRDWGLEALEEIMSVMDSGKIVAIFAGYSGPMKRVISSNEGFKRRVTKIFHFDDFSSEDLAKILHLKMSKQDAGSLLYGFKLHSSCSVDAIAEVIERETTEKQRKEMNGGLVDPMLVNARENLDLRLNSECKDADDLLTIMLEDLEAGLRLLKQ